MKTFSTRCCEFESASSGHVILFPHRGGFLNDYNNQAPENSLSNVRLCIERGFGGVEMDVCRTKDGHFVLMHDPKIDKRTTGEGRTDEKTLEELRGLKLLYKNG